MSPIVHPRPTPVASARDQAPKEVMADFERIRAELLESHRRLSALLAVVRDDPWLEEREADALAAHREQRDQLLASLGRLALTWMLRGGAVELLEARVGGAAVHAPSLPRSEPARREPEGPPASAAELERLRSQAISPTWTRAQQTAPREVEALALPALMDPHLPLPDDIPDAEAAAEELHRLGRAIQAQFTDHWVHQSREIQRALVGHVVARARRVQDELAPGVLTDALVPELDRVFSTMTAYSKREQPGFVFGLMRSHGPVHGSWLEDARQWWVQIAGKAEDAPSGNPERCLHDLQQLLDAGDATDEALVEAALAAIAAGVSPEDTRLVRMLADKVDLLKKNTEFKKLRKAIRELTALDQEFDKEMASPASAIPQNWPYSAHVDGKRASIIGGDLREEARARIQAAFGFESVEWVTTDHARKVQSLANAVTGGSVDLVIVLRRFIGHDVDRVILPACKAASVPWVSVEHGYGITQIRLAIERFLERHPGEGDAA